MEAYWKRQVPKSCGCLRFRGGFGIILDQILDRHERNRIAVQWNGCFTEEQSELPRPISRNSVEKDHGCTTKILFNNAGDNATMTLYNVTLTSQEPC